MESYSYKSWKDPKKLSVGFFPLVGPTLSQIRENKSKNTFKSNNLF